MKHLLLILGAFLLITALPVNLYAQEIQDKDLVLTEAEIERELERLGGVGSDTGPGLGVEEGDYRIYEVGQRMFQLIEGNLGSLIMVAAGFAALVSAAFGAYRAAVGMLVVAVGAFILRSLVEIFFNFS